MRIVRSLADYVEARARHPWGPLGPIGEPVVAMIPMQRRLPAAKAGRQQHMSAPTPRKAFESCPRCHHRALLTRWGWLCLVSTGGCGLTTPLTPREEAAAYRRAIAAAAAERRGVQGRP